MSSILELLPSIHMTIIGFGGAFFSAFAIYAHQKLHDAHLPLQQALTASDRLCQQDTYLGTGLESDFMPNGVLAWESKVQPALRKIKSLDPENCSDQEATSLFEQIIFIYQNVLTSYPLFGKAPIDLDEILKKETPISETTQKRLTSIARRLNQLIINWERNEEKYRKLAKRFSAIRAQATIDACAEDIEEIRETIRRNSPPGFEIPPINHPPYFNFEEDLTYHYSNILSYYYNILPNIRLAFEPHIRYNNIFKIKQRSLSVIELAAFSLIFGVITPLLSLELQFVQIPLWFSWFLLIDTTAPYFIILIWLWRKMSESNYL